ncbi:hypothetical protein M768_19770 [Cellulosimicrobium cellulans F16]|uniref:Uncharacterized protein n=1 Tax=Cellulosimicrobium cellulans F16 TaxID=1350482 RepID=A0A0M0F5R0_CELCE|nr:hypothetical protein [Cellulosimicrobium cellulans]KON72833.1 hypothetical protein M768_19770 [Cellulosimicrobium cellulans F16]
MSTTTYAPRLVTHRPAARAADRSDGRRLLASLVALAPSRASSGTVSGTFATTSPFAELAPDGRRPRRVVATMLATLAWVPVLALTLVAFAVVGVAAGLATAAVWCWRSVSPARAPQAGPGGADAPRGEVEPTAASTAAAVGPRGRRLVRDRTLGYDA